MKSGNEKDCIFNITVVPKSSRLEVRIDQSGNIKVYLTSAPVDGKANSELLKFLSKTLKIPKSSIRIIKGEKSRSKKIFINNYSEKDLINRVKE